MPQNHFVAGSSQISENELLFWKLRVDEGFEMTRMLHPVRERVAHEGDVISGAEFEFGRRCRVGEWRREHGQQEGDGTVVHETMRS